MLDALMKSRRKRWGWGSTSIICFKGKQVCLQSRIVSMDSTDHRGERKGSSWSLSCRIRSTETGDPSGAAKIQSLTGSLTAWDSVSDSGQLAIVQYRCKLQKGQEKADDKNVAKLTLQVQGGHAGDATLYICVSDHSDQVLRKDSKMGTMKEWRSGLLTLNNQHR